MGNSNEKLNQNAYSLLQIQENHVKEEMMYQSKISTSSQTNKQLIKKQYHYNESSENIISYLQKLKYLGQYVQSENLFLPIYCYIQEDGKICSQSKILEIYHQIYQINIKQEILARKKQYERFSEAEVWYLLYSMMNACRKFQPLKLKSGHLKTNHILLNERGHLKIMNQLTEPQPVIESSLPNFYAPEQLKNLREHRPEKIHLNVCQTYSIAIIILEICTFIDGDSFYDIYHKKINETTVFRAEDLLEKLKYSKLLQNLIKIMVSNKADRPLPSQIYQTFRPYEVQILNLQPFKFDIGQFNQNLQNSKISIVSSNY